MYSKPLYKTLRREVLHECEQHDRHRSGLTISRWTHFERRKLAQRTLSDLRRRFYPSH